eukprot:10030766-Karenia_brevis.AAC.1
MECRLVVTRAMMPLRSVSARYGFLRSGSCAASAYTASDRPPKVIARYGSHSPFEYVSHASPPTPGTSPRELIDAWSQLSTLVCWR